MAFQRGDEVEVRPLDEIRATLDGRGTVGGVPFMPEMERFAGRRARVWRRADRLCVEGAPTMRALDGFVFLEEQRCDGSAHEGCHRSCLLLWSELWLRRPGETDEKPAAPPAPRAEAPPAPEDSARLFCQSTALLAATRPLPAWLPGQYLRELSTRNIDVRELAYSLAATVGHHVDAALAWRRRLRPSRTPAQSLGLRPGEWVEVRALQEIERTLDSSQRNRGLEFSPGMSRYCGGRFRVARRVERIISEQTGRLRGLEDTVLLEGVNCDGACSRCCPRANPLYWREIWLKRSEAP